jgi:hypothetical protein
MFNKESDTIALPLLATNDAPFLLFDPGSIHLCFVLPLKSKLLTLLVCLGSSMMVLTVYSPGLWQDLLKHVAQIAPLDRVALLYSRLMLSTAGHIPTADFLKVIDWLVLFKTYF